MYSVSIGLGLMCFMPEELALTAVETEPELEQLGCCCTALKNDIKFFFADFSSLVADLFKFSVKAEGREGLKGLPVVCLTTRFLLAKADSSETILRVVCFR